MFSRHGGKNNLGKASVSDRFDHLLENGTPLANLVFVNASPIVLGNLQELPAAVHAKHLLARARLLSAVEGGIEGFDQSVMDDAQLVLNGVPIVRGPKFYGEVAVIDVREFQDLRAVVRVQIGLLCGYAIETGRLDFGQHVGEDGGVWFESHDAGVEIEGETSVVGEDVRNGGEDERELEEFVKVSSDEGVGVQVNGGFDADGVEGPDAQLGVLIDESGPNPVAVVRGLYEVDGEELPAELFEVTFGRFGYPFGKVNHDFPGVGVDFCEGVPEGGYGDGVAFGIERGDDGTFAVLRRGLAGILSGRNMIAGRQNMSRKNASTELILHVHIDEGIEDGDHRLVR